MANIGRIDSASLKNIPNVAPPIPQQTASANVGPTNQWARLAQIGVGKVQQLQLAARMQMAASTKNPVAFQNANRQNNQNNARIVDNETALGTPAKVATGGFHALRSVAGEAARPFELVGQQIGRQVKHLVGPTATQQQQSNILRNQATAQKNPEYIKATKGITGIPAQARIQAQSMAAKGAKAPQLRSYLSQQSKALENQYKRGAGAGLEIASYGVGVPELKGLFKGGEAVARNAGKLKTALKGGASLIKKTAPIGMAGAAGNVGATLQSNPNASGKQLIKAGAEGYAGGVALGVAGSAVGKAGRMIFGKEASTNTLRNIATNKLLQKGEDLNKPVKIPISDQSSEAVQGTISKTLPKTKIAIPVKTEGRPSDEGYTDTQFRLQFNKGAKLAAKSNPDVAGAYLKTNSKDPLTLIVHALASSNNFKRIGATVDKLMPQLNSGLRNRLVKSIQREKDPQETAHLLWDAAKDHETSITMKESMAGTPMGKKISFSDQSTKSSPESQLSNDLKEMVSQGKLKPSIRDVPTHKLKLGSDTVSDTLDTKTVAQYKADIKNGKSIPPIVVSRDANGNVFVQDGAHRLQAAKELGIGKVPTIEQTARPARPTANKLKLTKAKGTAVPSQTGQRVQASAIERGMEADVADVREHVQLNMKEQAQKAADLLNNDPERVADIISGKRSVPSGIHPMAVFNAAKAQALQNADGEMLRQLSHSPLLDIATAGGQTLRVLREGSATDPVSLINQIIKERARTAEVKMGQSVAKATTKLVKEASGHIKSPTKLEWTSFIEGIKC